jgi:DNA-binding transcriptional LysR family regulator
MKSSLNMGQIEAFRSVMLVGTVVGAARLMNVTQPGVSRSIGLMELRIGYKLFERHGRRLVPTPEGEALYREIESLYSSLDRIAQVAHDIGQQRAGALRIATLPAFSQSLVPRTIARFLSSRPEVTVFVQSLPSRQIADMVATRQFDVALVELPLSRPSISIEPLEPVPLVAAIPAKHRLASKSRVSLKDLDGERMILLSQHSYLRYQIEEAFSQLSVSANVVLETPTSPIACALVAAGVGITLVSQFAAEPFVGPDVVVRPIVEQLTSRTAVIYPYPGKRLMLAETFAADLREEMRKDCGAA